jgi:hypothetical protein
MSLMLLTSRCRRPNTSAVAPCATALARRASLLRKAPSLDVDSADRGRAPSSGLVMLRLTARDAFSRTCARGMNRGSTPLPGACTPESGLRTPVHCASPRCPVKEQPRFRHSYSLRTRPPRPVKVPSHARNARDAFGRLLQPTCQRRAPALREATPGSPEVSRAVHAPDLASVRRIDGGTRTCSVCAPPSSPDF